MSFLYFFVRQSIENIICNSRNESCAKETCTFQIYQFFKGIEGFGMPISQKQELTEILCFLFFNSACLKASKLVEKYKKKSVLTNVIKLKMVFHA